MARLQLTQSFRRPISRSQNHTGSGDSLRPPLQPEGGITAAYLVTKIAGASQGGGGGYLPTGLKYHTRTCHHAKNDAAVTLPLRHRSASPPTATCPRAATAPAVEAASTAQGTSGSLLPASPYGGAAHALRLLWRAPNSASGVSPIFPCILERSFGGSSFCATAAAAKQLQRPNTINKGWWKTVLCGKPQNWGVFPRPLERTPR